MKSIPRVQKFVSLVKDVDTGTVNGHIKAGFEVVSWLQENPTSKQADFADAVALLRPSAKQAVSKDRILYLASLRCKGLADFALRRAYSLASVILDTKTEFTLVVTAEAVKVEKVE
jgi:hypothetical protein